MLRIGAQTLLKNRGASVPNNIKRCLATTAAAKPKEKPALQPSQSFVANMFRGRLKTAEAFPYPFYLNSEQVETVAMVVDPLNKFFTEINDPVKNDDTGKVDQKTLDAFWELGGFSIHVPTEYGGMGANNTQYARMGEIVGANDMGFGVCLGAHQGIGFKGILLYGTEAQKAKYLPQVSTGKVYAAFALTEPSSGSDAASIQMRAQLSEDGKHWILNGSKIWISNGGIANIFTVFAQAEVDDPKTGGKKKKMTAFIVERGFGGVTTGPPEQKMGIKCSSTTELHLEDVKVPVENVLGNIGDGFKVAMNTLNNGRFGMSATLAGTMAKCIQKAAEHASCRVQFGQKIEEYGAIQEKLARMALLQYATQSMAYMISGNMDNGSEDYQLEAAISKVFASESAWYVCDEAIQILGGMGFMKETGLERICRDIRIFRIFEGSNDILRLFVALSGIQYAGGHLKKVQKALKNPAANLGLIAQHISARAARSVGLGGVDLSAHVDSSLVEAAKLCGQSIDAFGGSIEKLLIKHGKNIINEQYLLNRIADNAIDIYAMTCVLSRATRSAKLGLASADHELLMAKTWCIEAAERCRINEHKLHNIKYVEIYPKFKQISKNICEAQGVASINPINV